MIVPRQPVSYIQETGRCLIERGVPFRRFRQGMMIWEIPGMNGRNHQDDLTDKTGFDPVLNHNRRNIND